MEKPEIVLMGPFRIQMYLAEDMDIYLAELKASIKEMMELSEWMQIYGFVILPDAGKQAIDRARALIGEE